MAAVEVRNAQSFSISLIYAEEPDTILIDAAAHDAPNSRRKRFTRMPLSETPPEQQFPSKPYWAEL